MIWLFSPFSLTGSHLHFGTTQMWLIRSEKKSKGSVFAFFIYVSIILVIKKNVERKIKFKESSSKAYRLNFFTIRFIPKEISHLMKRQSCRNFSVRLPDVRHTHITQDFSALKNMTKCTSNQPSHWKYVRISLKLDPTVLQRSSFTWTQPILGAVWKYYSFMSMPPRDTVVF